MVSHGGHGFNAMRSMRRGDAKLAQTKLTKGMFGRILRFARPYRRDMTIFLVTVVLAAGITVATPVLAGDRRQRDHRGRRSGRSGPYRATDRRAGDHRGVAVAGQPLVFGEGRRGPDLPSPTGRVFACPVDAVGVFSRAQTGALVSRLNNDVLGAQRAFTSTLSGLVSNAIAVVLTLAVMASQSWQITLLSLVLVPVFLVPAKMVGRKLATLTNESFELNARMNNQMTERFGVAGALLVKLFGRPDREVDEFSRRADRVRDIG